MLGQTGRVSRCRSCHRHQRTRSPCDIRRWHGNATCRRRTRALNNVCGSLFITSILMLRSASIYLSLFSSSNGQQFQIESLRSPETLLSGISCHVPNALLRRNFVPAELVHHQPRVLPHAIVISACSNWRRASAAPWRPRSSKHSASKR